MFLTILIALVSLLNPQRNYSHYYTKLPVELRQVEAVQVPDTTLSLADFGGVADGTTLNTEAFKKAIKQLSKIGGGHLVIPAGVWLTGPIELKSNIDLHVEEQATILFSTDKSLYYTPGKSRCTPFIKASKAENICITGSGTINGQGEYWRPAKRSKYTDEEWGWFTALGGTLTDGGNLWLPFNLNNGIPNVGNTPEEQESLRNHLVQFTDCKNVLVEGVTLLNSPKFHLVPSHCENLIVDGVTIRCPWNAQNGDALDPGCTQTALIVNCTIDCGDDGICMKGGVAEAGVRLGGNSDYLIQDNTVLHAHGGFVIGSEFSGGMRRLVVRQCKFIGTDVGLRFKSAPGRGGTCEDIYCYDIQMQDIQKEAIVFETGYADQGAVLSATAGDDKSAFFPDFCNFSFSNIQVDGAGTAIRIVGLPGHPVHDLQMRNIKMKRCQKGLIFKYAEKVSMKKVRIQANQPDNIDAATCADIVRK